jgi:predicted O-linked N-acetylglucosamine transferase (SPINDLY family)
VRPPPAQPKALHPAVKPAQALMDRGQYAQALTLLRPAVTRTPNDANLCMLTGACLMFTGQLEPALYQARRAIDLAPHAGINYQLSANVLAKLGRLEEALEHARRATELTPDNAMAWNTLGAVHELRHDEASAYEPLMRALAIEPTNPVIALNASKSIAQCARPEEAVRILENALRLHPRDAQLLVSYVPGLNYPSGVPVQDRVRAARHLAALVESRFGGRVLHRVADYSPTRPLRVGVLSYDMRRHACSFFMRSLLEHLPRPEFTVVGFHTSAQRDEVTGQLAALCDGFVHLKEPGPLETARAIADERIDVLFETGGFTAGSRAEAVCFLPAPVCVNYLGYPATTALAGMHERVVDAHTDPPGSEDHCTEHLTRLDPCFLCYSPGPDAPTPRPAHAGPDADPTRPIVLGSFSATTKISRDCVALWARVLREVPGTRFLLKGFMMGSPHGRASILEQFAGHGIGADRLDLVPRLKDMGHHLRAYDAMDIALDTLPYAGTTTTCEALFMGVPYVTLEGTDHVSRVGVSLLHAIGRPRWIAKDPAGFVEIVRALVADRANLAHEQRSLRERMLASPLCDGPGFGVRMGKAVRAMWQRACTRAAGGTGA